MAVALRQETNFQNAAAAASVVLAYASNVVAGNPLIVVAVVNSNATITGISDTLGNTWTTMDSIVDATPARRGTSWKAIANASGADTVTVTFSTSTTAGSLVIAEFSGASASPFDGNIAQTQSTPVSTSADAITTGSGAASTNSNQPALIYGVGLNFGSGGGTPAAGTGFTTGQTISWSSGLGRTETKRITTTGSAQAATWTVSATTASGFTFMAIIDELASVASADAYQHHLRARRVANV